jgi:phosphoglycolate phosphatase
MQLNWRDYSILLFDLDGTLVDSAADIYRSMNFALYDLGLPLVLEQQIRVWVGRGAGRLVHCVIEHLHLTADWHEPLLKQFMQRYQAEVCVESRVYDGVIPFLNAAKVQGCQLACVTNKPYQPARDLLAALNLSSYFSLLLGGDSLDHRKPHPAPIWHAMQYYQASASQTLMIGDSRNDVEAAHAAGVACIALTYGYNHGEPIATCQPDLILDSLRELL